MKAAALTVLAIALAANLSMAQKPVQGSMGMTAGVTGFSFVGFAQPGFTSTLTWKYLVTDKITLRMGIRVGTNKNTTERDSLDAGMVNGQKNTTTSKWSYIGVAPGVSYHFAGTDRLDPYLGLELNIGMGDATGSISNEMDSTLEVVTSTGGISGSKVEAKTTGAKISTIGFTGFAGFNYFVTDMLAFGGEFGWGMASVSSKEGKTTRTVSGPDPNTFGPLGATNTGSTPVIKESGLDIRGTGTVTITVFFW